ncbi:MAG TPA: DoxX family protein, partial [Thermoanaerobaculia bacterium]|nr:DoxX family protein [Thermoanaerobaculia bacterium]
IGLAEILGAAGLVLPMLTGVLPWLTPLAAAGLAVIVLMASGFHLRADERLPALETTLWAGIATIIAIGRWQLLASRVAVSPSLLAVALAVLVPSAIVNVIILWKRGRARTPARPPRDRRPTAAERRATADRP